jgi:CelD/BcsL family acetyltransferase involved in cellulose biosynthesis
MSAAQATAPVYLRPAFRTQATAEALTVRVFRTLEELKAIRSDWEQLLAAYPLASTFSTWEWLSSWWRHFAGHRKLLVIGAYSDGMLIGLAPFSTSRENYGGVRTVRVLRLMGDGSLDSDNLDMPVLPGMESLFVESVMRQLRMLGAEWDICELNTLPPSSPAASMMARRCQSEGWTFFEDTRACSAIPLPKTWPAYLASLSSEDRNNVKRYRHRLESRYRVRVSRCTREDEIEEYLNALFSLHQGRWQSSGELGSFASVERRGFYRDLSAALLSKSWLELWGLKIEEQFCAVQFAFRYADRVYQLQEGYDHTRRSDRVGLVLRSEVLRKLIDEDVNVYDFLGGEDKYKARWGAKTGQYRTLRFALPFTAGSSILWIVRKAADGKVWLREHMPSGAWKQLKHIAHAVGM